MLDDIDSRVLELLTRRGRMTWTELGGELGLSPPAAADRVHRLEERGIITGYAAMVDPGRVGCGLTAFVAVSLERPAYREPFLERVEALAEVAECHHVAGDDDYLLKVRCADTRALEDLVSTRLKGLDGIVRTRTVIVLSSTKETVVPPLPPATRRGPRVIAAAGRAPG